ncbi:MAG: hypothetical protein WBO55_08365 [Rhizobiaceae bacterium]
MQGMKIGNLAIGIFAGIAGGLMALAGFQAGTAAIALIFAAPAAIYLASLAWGPLSGFAAALAATAVLAYDGELKMPLVALVVLFAPAAWAGHLANLGQVLGDGRTLVWYPVGRILWHMMLVLTVGFWVAGYIGGFSEDRIAPLFVELMKEISRTNPELPPVPDEVLMDSARLYAAILPLIIPAIWLMLHMLVLHLSSQVTRLSGKLARPAEDIAANVTLPPAALVFTGIGLLAMLLLDSPFGEAGSVMAGLGIAGLGLTGLGELHTVTRNRPSRPLILFLSWFTLILFSLPIVIFAVMGAGRVLRTAGISTTPPTGGKS